jgi:catechol 2,3-dioxygenase-like lactoylglutathione lyase family enzyme
MVCAKTFSQKNSSYETRDSDMKLIRSASYFPVANVERSLTFYQLVLGFPCEYSAGEPPQFAICSRDGLAIMLREVSESKSITPSEKQGGTWDVFFWVSDANELHAEFKAKGVEIVYGPLIQEAYHMREFAIRDCDGHVLGFGERLQK